MSDDKTGSKPPQPRVSLEDLAKGYTPAPGRVGINEGFVPGHKVQGGYTGPVGAAPPPPSGGSSFKPATSQAKPSPPKK
jgi:hypothetical protein